MPDISTDTRIGEEQAPLFGLQYKVSEYEHRRCLHRLAWMELPLLPFRQARALIGVTMFGALGIAYFIYPLLPALVRFGLLPRSFVADEVSKQLTAFYIAFPVTGSLVLGLLTILQFLFVEVALRRGAGKWSEEVTMFVSPEGVRDVSPPQTVSEQTWRDIVFIRQTEGDIYMVARSYQRSLYIPCSAFASVENAKTFYRALVTLKQAKGDPAALSAEVRATFPPPQPL